MSGFSYPKPIFNSSIYNSLFYLSLDPSGFLTLDYANTLYLPKNDYRLTYISGITVGVAQSGIALVPDTSLNISGINALSCASLSIGGSLVDLSSLSYLNGITIGSTSASKALVVDASKNISGINSLSATTIVGTISTAIQSNITQLGTLSSLNVSGNVSCGSLSIGGSSLNISQFSSITAGTASASKALVLDSSLNISGINSLSATTLTGTLSTANQPNINQLASNVGLGVSPAFRLDFGATGAIQMLSLYSVTGSSFIGWGASGNYLRHQSINGSKFYYGSTIGALGTEIATMNLDGMLLTGRLSADSVIASTGDITASVGNLILDDSADIFFYRTISTADLNSKIYCADTANLTLESSRGSGWVNVITNRTGTTSNAPSFAIYDSTTGVGSAYWMGFAYYGYRRTITIGDLSSTYTAPDKSIVLLASGYRTIQTDGCFYVNNVALSYIVPSFVWDVSGSGMGSNSSNYVGIGNHDSATSSNRTRIGLVYLTNGAPSQGARPYRFDSSGQGASCYSGSWNTTSDLRLKSSISGCDYGLQEILQLKSCRYILKGNEADGFKIGFIAQQVCQILPEVCNLSPWDDHDKEVGEEGFVPMSIEYTSIIPVLVNAIQQLNQKVEQQQRIINELSNKIFNAI